MTTQSSQTQTLLPQQQRQQENGRPQPYQRPPPFTSPIGGLPEGETFDGEDEYGLMPWD